VLLAELGLYGRFVEIPERLFFSRDHAERSLRAMPIHFRSAWFDPANRGRTVFPHWRMLREYLACVGRAPLAPGERARCRLQLLRWPGVNANWARLGADLVAVVAPGAVPAMLRIKDRVLRTEDDPTRLKRTSR
jgi:hypothetical protein